MAGGGTSQLFFSRILTKVTAVRVKGQLFLRKPFFQDSSLQLLLSTRVTFDKSTVNVYSEYKEYMNFLQTPIINMSTAVPLISSKLVELRLHTCKKSWEFLIIL